MLKMRTTSATWLALLAPGALALQLSVPTGPQVATIQPRAVAAMQVEAPDKPLSMSDMSAQMKEARERMESDESTRLYMQALRGSNLNDDATAASGTKLQVVEVSGGGALPTTYQPEVLRDYFDKRPGAVLQRLFQIASTSGGWATGLAIAALKGDLKAGSAAEVEQVAKLREIIVSLGPFFIKLGQALSIRPDILSPQAMVEMQQLCDKVPSFDSKLAFATIEQELGRPVMETFSKITPEPVAAASLGQVYKATLRATGEEVAVKVQRPFVLETVSLDLYLIRKLGVALKQLGLAEKLDLVSLLDEFASRFYAELDYDIECANGERVRAEMAKLTRIVIPKNYPEYTARRVHVAEWIDGEKLSQSQADDVGELVNLGVIAYLTQLLESGFFHADPHPGNMMRTPDGKLVILDFGLMTEVTDDQKYGMIEAIAHLIHRDYEKIGDDFVSLDFIPKGVDTSPIVPALARVFDAALAGGGAKSINFQELAADLAEITFQFPFRIPPYFALVIRAISVLEGIALVGNPEFAIVDEAYPYISRRLLTDQSPRLRAALRYMVYGKGESFDVDRMIDMLQALEKFVAVRDEGDGSAFKVDGVRAGVDLGNAGTMVGTKTVQASSAQAAMPAARQQQASSGDDDAAASAAKARVALDFFFSDDGAVFRGFLLDEVVRAVDSLSREAASELALSVGLRGQAMPSVLRALAPPLSDADRKVVASIRKLVSFFLGDAPLPGDADGATAAASGSSLVPATNAENLRKLQAVAPVLLENQAQMRAFGLLIVGRLAEKQTERALGWVRGQVAKADPVASRAASA